MPKKNKIISSLLCALLWLAVPQPGVAGIALFGSQELESRKLEPFVKWTGMLKKDPQHRDIMRRSCKTAGHCLYDEWARIASTVKAMPFEAMLKQVNHDINASQYVTDMVNWGQEDYWETPYEFFVKDGDCEDYAIAKYMTLKLAGVSPATMRVVVLQDRNLNLLHSVLVVHNSGRNYILDNQIGQVVLDSSIHHYTPIYSINEQAWWRHVVN